MGREGVGVGGLPAGTVTFLFTDLEGSTRLWEEYPDGMRAALARHDAILRDAVVLHGGQIVKTTGDGLHAVFAVPLDAVDAAVDAQIMLAEESWEETGPLKVRMGVHTGTAEIRGDDYYGTAVNRAARIAAAANGGQILVSLATEELVRDDLAGGTSLRDLGEHRLRDLGRPERLFQTLHPDLVDNFAAPRSLDAFPGNLRAQVTSFVGRADDLAAINELLDEARLVTLTGVGGAGKTRLALQVAADRLGSYEHGAWVVELAAVATAEVLPEVAGAALGVQQHTGRTLRESVIEFLRNKDLLLVLDNCEHLIGPIKELAADIIDAAPRVRILATSREGLGVRGERLWPVGSLGLPGAGASAAGTADSESARLFADRARAVRPVFRVDDENADAVAEICRRLDGIPLAIELAAARVAMLAPADIAARLDERFRLLTGGRRVAVERHETLRSTVEWSYDLLDASTQVTFERLAVFSGGFTLDAAEAVIADEDIDALDVLDLLDDLVAKSMVVAEDHHGSVRYRLLETLRQYARERLEERGDPDRVRRRHAEHFGRFVVTVGDLYYGPAEGTALARLRDELENIRSAVTWSVDTSAATVAIQLTAPLTLLGVVRPQLGLGLLAELAITTPAASGEAGYPEACSAAAANVLRRGDYALATRIAEQGIDACTGFDDPRAFPPTFARLMVAGSNADDDALREWLAEAQARLVHADEKWKVAGQSFIAMVQRGWAGEPVEATRPAAQEAIAMARRTGSADGLSTSLYMYGRGMSDIDPPSAVAALEEAMHIADQSETILRFLTRAALAPLHAQQGYAAESMRLLREAIVGWHDQGSLNNLAWTVEFGVSAFDALGHLDVAAVASGILDAGIIVTAVRPGEAGQRYRETQAEMRRHLGDAEFERLHAQGAAMTYDEAIAFVLTQADEVAQSTNPTSLGR